MSRAIDICTCGKDRADHGNATGHEFFPNPQPERPPERNPVQKLADFLATLGEVRVTGTGEWAMDFIVKNAATKETWEVTICKRSA